MNSYEEIKLMVKASKRALIKEDQKDINHIKKTQGLLIKEEIEKVSDEKYVEDQEIEEKEKQDLQKRSFKIQGSIISIHGDRKSELQLTLDEKVAFKESIEEFRNEISEIVDFQPLNVYQNNVEWSGKIPDKKINFHFSTEETNGVYMDAEMLKLDNDIVELIEKLQKYFEKFKVKWNKILGSRKETEK
jgi:hypothetical protein